MPKNNNPKYQLFLNALRGWFVHGQKNDPLLCKIPKNDLLPFGG